MANNRWDAIVVGGSAAGLSAAQMLGRARRKVLVVDGGSPRNRFASHIHGVLGHDGTPPGELVAAGRRELQRYGVEFASGNVTSVADGDGVVSVTIEGSETQDARVLVVATGVTDNLPPIPGLAQRWGISVLHCPYCHGWEARDKKFGVVTTTPMSMHQAELVRQWSDDVTVFTAGAGEIDPEVEQRLQARGVKLVSAPVVEIDGDGDSINVVRTADGAEHDIEIVFTGGPMTANDSFLDGLNLDRSDTPFGNFLKVDDFGRTSHERIWAVGNVSNPMSHVPMAMSAGTTGGAFANAILVAEDGAIAVEESKR
ncbi:MAG: NAD(P)/FAD-dependent oxidoreductase [Candidatus Nanopelagicales bacterium]